MDNNFENLWIIVFLPLIGSLLAYVIGKSKKSMAGIIATGASFLAFIQTIRCFFALKDGAIIEQTLFNWIGVGSLNIDFALRFDSLSAVMCLIVTGIGSLIHLYSVGYMAEDESSPRFFAYLNLFLFSMLTLVLGANLPVLFIGWEGVGLCSYLLIGFWFHNYDYAVAGRKAFIANRIGDVAFIIGMFIIFYNFKTLNFLELQDVVTTSTTVPYFFITLATLFLFIGATGKSAQIPLFVWLPDAMAGPTPVSALIHAATMVTAGIYMLARTNFLFVLSPFTSSIIIIIAGMTSLIAALIALVQNDIKKVLAYSTVSQLGFMFLAAGSGAYWVALFHVVTHAFFKACLFLGAGSVIHGCHHEQDMREMGGLAKKMPITFITYLISTIAIAGVFPFAGYFSKHAILGSLAKPELTLFVDTKFFIILATVTAVLTAFYMTRSLVMTFFGTYRGHAKPHESPITMTLPLIVLAALGAAGGFFLHHHDRLQSYLANVIPSSMGHASESIIESLIHSWPGFLGIAVALIFYLKLNVIPKKLSAVFPAITNLLKGKCYFDEIYETLLLRPIKIAAGILFKFVDRNLIDFTVNGTGQFVEMNGEVLRQTQSGQIRSYMLWMFIATIMILVFCFIW